MAKRTHSRKMLAFVSALLLSAVAVGGCTGTESSSSSSVSTETGSSSASTEASSSVSAEISSSSSSAASASQTSSGQAETGTSIEGLTFEKELELKYANNFTVGLYQDGYKLITDSSERKILYVPEGKTAPAVPEDVILLQGPVQRVGCFSTTHATHMQAVGALDKVCLVTTDADKWHIPEIKAGVEGGQILFVGRNSAPDYEKILEAKPDVILVGADTMHGSDEVLQKFNELGIPWIGMGDHKENHPLGRLEWLKLCAAVLEQEETGDAYFAQQEKKVLDIGGDNSVGAEKPKVLQTYIYKGTVYVKNGGDYVAKMIELAGGEYAFETLNPDQSGSTKMTVEDFFKDVQDIDLLIYDTTSDTSVKTISDILANGEYLADIKAVKEGNVWGIVPQYWQSASKIGDIIADMSTLIHAPAGEVPELEYYFRLEK